MTSVYTPYLAVVRTGRKTLATTLDRGLTLIVSQRDSYPPIYGHLISSFRARFDFNLNFCVIADYCFPGRTGDLGALSINLAALAVKKGLSPSVSSALKEFFPDFAKAADLLYVQFRGGSYSVGRKLSPVKLARNSRVVAHESGRTITFELVGLPKLVERVCKLSSLSPASVRVYSPLDLGTRVYSAGAIGKEFRAS